MTGLEEFPFNIRCEEYNECLIAQNYYTRRHIAINILPSLQTHWSHHADYYLQQFWKSSFVFVCFVLFLCCLNFPELIQNMYGNLCRIKTLGVCSPSLFTWPWHRVNFLEFLPQSQNYYERRIFWVCSEHWGNHDRATKDTHWQGLPELFRKWLLKQEGLMAMCLVL